MEPRPLNKPQRSSPTPPAPSVPPVDRGSWNPPPPSTPSHAQPVSPPDTSYAGSSFDASANRSAWYEPPAASPPPVGPQGYSPGPALTPIDGGRGARLLGPLLALIVLAAIVGTAVFLIFQVFDDGGRKDGGNQAAGTNTALAQAAPTTPATVEATITPQQDPNAVAGADETAAPTGGAAAQANPTPEATATPQQAEPTRSVASARSMLPSSSDLPDGFQRTEDDKRAKDVVAASFSNANEALGLLDQWKWRENAYRTFEIPPESNPDQNGTTYINVSVHRFGDKKGAAAALTYFADDVITTQGLTELDVEKIGDETRALTGAPDGSNLVVIYVRTGNYLIRIGGSSPLGDPTNDVIALAKKIVGG